VGCCQRYPNPAQPIPVVLPTDQWVKGEIIIIFKKKIGITLFYLWVLVQYNIYYV
jgi:hypothetical protein